MAVIILVSALMVFGIVAAMITDRAIYLIKAGVGGILAVHYIGGILALALKVPFTNTPLEYIFCVVFFAMLMWISRNDPVPENV